MMSEGATTSSRSNVGERTMTTPLMDDDGSDETVADNCSTRRGERRTVIMLTIFACSAALVAVSVGFIAPLAFMRRHHIAFFADAPIGLWPQGQSTRRGLRTRLHRESRVVNGRTPSSPHDYPYLASLQNVSPLSRRTTHVCGGALISPSIIVTAAHCVHSVKRVVLGGHDLRKEEDVTSTVAMTVNKSDMRKHPSYDPRTFDHDLALIKLPQAVEINPAGAKNGRPIIDVIRAFEPRYLLPNGDTMLREGHSDSDDDLLTVMGFGRHSSGGITTGELLEATVDYVANDECQARYGSRQQVKDSMLCAHSTQGMDACQGDSGGPLVMRGDVDERRGASRVRRGDVLVGVVSWGSECGHASYPGVYARMNDVGYEWIEATICKDLSPESCRGGKLRNFYAEYNGSSTTTTKVPKATGGRVSFGGSTKKKDVKPPPTRDDEPGDSSANNNKKPAPGDKLPFPVRDPAKPGEKPTDNKPKRPRRKPTSMTWTVSETKTETKPAAGNTQEASANVEVETSCDDRRGAFPANEGYDGMTRTCQWVAAGTITTLSLRCRVYKEECPTSCRVRRCEGISWTP